MTDQQRDCKRVPGSTYIASISKTKVENKINVSSNIFPFTQMGPLVKSYSDNP